MEQSDLLRHVVGVFEKLGIRYFVTGSIVSVFYGEPRFTNDVDIVADIPIRTVSEFCKSFPPSEYYVSDEAARQAVLSKGQFNIIHPASGLKVDVIVPPDSDYNRLRFGRAISVRPAPGLEANFSSIEDVIVMKMEFYRIGESEKHLRDIASVLKISGDQVDRNYIEEWANKLGLAETWRAILSRTKH